MEPLLVRSAYPIRHALGQTVRLRPDHLSAEYPPAVDEGQRDTPGEAEQRLRTGEVRLGVPVRTVPPCCRLLSSDHRTVLMRQPSVVAASAPGVLVPQVQPQRPGRS